MRNIKSVIRKSLKIKSKEHLIYTRYTYNRKYILFRTDVYVSISNWNASSGRVKKSFNYEKFNLILENAEKEFLNIILDLKIKNIEPTLFNVKNEYYKVKNKFHENIGPKKINERKFITDYQEFIDKREYDKLHRNSTIKAYKTTKQKLIDFQKDKNYQLNYDIINNEFYKEFLKYLRIDKGLFDNTIDKHIKNLKTFMTYALENNKHNNNVYHTFKRTRNKADFVYLEFDEIRKLYYEFKTENQKKVEIRDTFILGCLTGLRFSDLTNLTCGNFVITRNKLNNEIIQNANSSYIQLSTLKTDEKVKIPLNNFICDLIEKYDIPNKKITFLKQNNQVFNREIKTICKEVGITSLVKIKRKKGVDRTEFEQPKCQFISSHTMRRTFITLLASRTELTNIQAVSGHRDIKILTDYIKRNDGELNAIRSSFNEIFYSNVETGPENKDKVKATIIKTRVVSQ